MPPNTTEGFESDLGRSFDPAALTPENEVLKMRCPRCRKLYSVQSGQMRAASAPLKFQCVGCQSRFGARLASPTYDGPLAVETFEITERAPTEAPRSARVATERAPQISELRCPKCGSRNSLGASECRFCGVVFNKLKQESADGDSLDMSLSGRRELNDLWDLVMKDYENRSSHERFLSACQAANALSFASQKYARILSVSPNEEVARKMRQKIVALASYRFETARESGLWEFRIPKLSNVVLALAGATMVMGFMLPGMKNLAALGFSMVALTVGVRYFLRPLK